MDQQTEEKEIKDWTSVLYCPGNDILNQIYADWPGFRIKLILESAENFYTDIRRIQHLLTPPVDLKKDFSELTNDEKLPWLDFASALPSKLRTLNLFIRPWKEFCRTCLITDNDLEKLAAKDHRDIFSKKLLPRRSLIPFQFLTDAEKRFYIELNHLIPPVFKKAGYELVRPEEISEISDVLIRKFARAIHSRYQHESKRKGPVSKKSFYMPWIRPGSNAGNEYTSDFDDLPVDIQSSNLDNAYHIPTKLLAIGYKIRPVRKGFEASTLHLSEEEIETMAKVEHIRWCWDKILNGWFYGELKDTRKKIHPGIIPYEDLEESEKEKDRELVRLIPALLKDIDYEAFPVNPDKISKLPYAIKPHSSIHRILDETRKMNAQIRKLVTLSPETDKMVKARNTRIEEAIKEIESSYLYAQHIQKTFLPDNLYIREIFPDSFVLFKPRDIVSGDFYFFSRQGNNKIFAAADCTGHGIPGALLSIIGYGILDQAINELKLTEPPEILNHLYSRVHRFLRRNEDGTGLYDDLDIALCIFDVESNLLNYAGVSSPLYHLSEKGLIEYKSQNSIEECCESARSPFVSERIQLKQGDTIYLFSDGYIDQFGGSSHKKYQSGRFKDLLLAIRNLSMPEQSDRLYEELERWRDENDEDQTDDILVTGIRI